MNQPSLGADRQLALVDSWFDRALTEPELTEARELLARGDRPPYVARVIDMRARAVRPVDLGAQLGCAEVQP